ncbi:MAG: tetratricopeptide repeat protein [Prevotella sp.]|nr:tetratricopeptide repeat protein [Bacteroides sp.]MCM1367059.1 tetratricopeptide repeat protein [Prevotella sp.]MCM1437042.1 tetratricopeptide repeat protein [Prevotella sp.]
MKKLLYISASLILALICGGRLAADVHPDDGRVQKARYFYMEGVRLQAEDKAPEAYEMFKRASRIDPEYVEALSAYGSGRLYINNDSLQTPDALLQSISLLRPYVDKYPADYQESLYYAYLASQLDTASEAIRVFSRLANLYPEKSDILLRLADVYARTDSIKEAVDVLDRYEKIEGKSFPLSSKKVTFLIAVGDTANAIGEADSFLKYNPLTPDGYIMKGAVFEAVGQPDSAFYNYSLAEKLFPENGRTLVILSNYYRNLNDSVNYDKYTYQALLSEDFDLEQKIAILQEYLRTLVNDKSNFTRGDHLFDVLNQQYPYEPQMLDLAARYSYEKGDTKKAVEYISRAIDLQPDIEDYYGGLMSYCIDLDNYKGAMEAYHRAEEYLQPGEGVKFIYATAATQAGEYDEASRILKTLLDEIIPDAPLFDSIPITNQVKALDYTNLMRASVIYGMLGDMYYQAKDKDKSFGAYENAIRLMPMNYMTLNNYAYFIAQTPDGDLNKAEKLSKEAVDANPDNPTFLDTYAYILFKQGKFPQALEFQIKGVKISEDNGQPEAELYNHLGDILSMLGRDDEAIINWKKAFEMDNKNITVKKKIDTGKYIPDPHPEQ